MSETRRVHWGSLLEAPRPGEDTGLRLRCESCGQKAQTYRAFDMADPHLRVCTHRRRGGRGICAGIYAAHPEATP